MPFLVLLDSTTVLSLCQWLMTEQTKSRQSKMGSPTLLTCTIP